MAARVVGSAEGSVAVVRGVGRAEGREVAARAAARVVARAVAGMVAVMAAEMGAVWVAAIWVMARRRHGRGAARARCVCEALLE